MDFSPYKSPPLPIPSLEHLSPRLSGPNKINFTNSTLDSLPSDIRKWTYIQVTSFIVAVLNLPKFLVIDIKLFIINKEIDGKKLLTLDEEKLAILGFNRLWCHHLSLAIRDLNILDNMVKQEIKNNEENDQAESSLNLIQTNEIKTNSSFVPVLSKDNIDPLKKINFPNYLIDKDKKYSTLPKNKSYYEFSTIDKKLAKSTFKIPEVENVLLERTRMYETVGFKADLNQLKRALRKKSLDENLTDFDFMSEINKERKDSISITDSSLFEVANNNNNNNNNINKSTVNKDEKASRDKEVKNNENGSNSLYIISSLVITTLVVAFFYTIKLRPRH